MIKLKINRSISISIAAKQKGATLFTALVFLALMTIVSVSAAKISMLDVFVSGNNQQQMELYQETARELDDHTDPAKLISLILDNEPYENANVDWNHDFPATALKPQIQEAISNRDVEYQCGAINGLATSQGSDNKCHLFDFSVRAQKNGSSARDWHVRGAGKEYPKATRHNLK